MRTAWKMSKCIAIFYHQRDWSCRFLPFGRCFYLASHWVKSDSFLRKNSKLQHIFSVICEAWHYHLPPPFLKQWGLLQNLMFCGSLFFVLQRGRRNTDRCAARSDDGVETSGSTAQSDVRERSEGNPSPDLNTNLYGYLYPVLEKIFTKQNWFVALGDWNFM